MPGMKQDFLAFELGKEWNQQKISLPEQKEKIDADILDQVSAILKIPAEAIRNFDEQQVITVISSTFNDNSQLGTLINNYNNPIDAVLKLHEEKMVFMSGC